MPFFAFLLMKKMLFSSNGHCGLRACNSLFLTAALAISPPKQTGAAIIGSTANFSDWSSVNSGLKSQLPITATGMGIFHCIRGKPGSLVG